MQQAVSFTFPSFKKVTPEDKEFIGNILKDFPPYSDFNVLSLLCWNAHDDNSFSVLKDNLLIRIKDYLGEGYLYSLIGKGNSEEAIDRILELTDKVSLLPEIVIQNLTPGKYEVGEDRNSFDYVIKTRELFQMTGKEYRSVRKGINTFIKKYPGYNLKVLDLHDIKTQDLLISLNRKWCEDKKFDKTKTAEDLDSIRKFVRAIPRFNSFCLGLFVDGSLIAFTLNELLNGGWAMGHFGKADLSYDKSSVFLEHATSGKLSGMGYTHLNLEQDTGLAGLREAKMILRPAYFLKKYTVKKRV